MSDGLPTVASVRHLKPRDLTGALYTALCLSLTFGGLALTQLGRLVPELPPLPQLWLGGSWVLGQLLIAFGLLQWFVLLHECGHGVLFRRRIFNRVVGHMAGFFCTIPFLSWAPIHAMHHKWTGWQDLDPTTASLVPRPLATGERLLMNFCWRYWVPAFSVLYRVSNFWNLPRLSKLLTRKGAVRGVAVNAVVLAGLYVGVLVVFGPLNVLMAVGPGLVLSLCMLDPIMMSQHTHIPLKVSGGEAVKPFPTREQGVFTRSLRFPAWFSKLILLHFDAHEVHHVFPAVPGYRLREIDLEPTHEQHWLKWILMARRLPAEVFLFQNRDRSGSEV